MSLQRQHVLAVVDKKIGDSAGKNDGYHLQKCVIWRQIGRPSKGSAVGADKPRQEMNPLELQVLSIVCGVAGNNQSAPPPNPPGSRQPIVALPPSSADAGRPQRVAISR